MAKSNKKSQTPKTKEVTVTLTLTEADIKCSDCGVMFHWSGYSGKLPVRCSDCQTIRVRHQKKLWQRERYKQMKEALIKVREQEQVKSSKSK